MNKLVLLSVVLLAACAVRQPDTGDTVPSSSSGAAGGFAVSPDRAASSAGGTSSANASRAAAALRRIRVSASGASFLPEVVEVERGERVQLLVSGPAPFTFAIPQLRILEHAIPGRSTAVDVPTDVSGLFELVCTDGCGSGSTLPRGRILIR